MRCFNCGSMVSDAAEFCASCGVDVLNPKQASSRLVLCPTCGDSFPAAHLDQRGLTNECPVCQRREEERRLEEEEKQELKRERDAQSDRAGLRSQRRAERFEVAKCFVRVNRLGLTAMLLRRNGPTLAPLIDLSRTGLQCIADGAYAKGESIGVSLLVPAFKEPLSLQATVMWVAPAGEGRARIGLNFDDVEEKVGVHLKALEKHEALREAGNIREEKSRTGQLPKVEPDLPKPRPADF